MSEPSAPNRPSAEPCEPLPWDSEFFGIPVARVVCNVLDGPTAQSVDEWCRRRGIGLLYLLASSEDAATIQLAESFGYHLTDVRVTLEYAKTVGDALLPSAATIRPAVTEDLPRLQAIARVSHTDSRFYYDGHLPRSRCDDLFATWIANSMNGFAAALLVSGEVGHPTGYVTCHSEPITGHGTIGLIAVAAEAQGRGLGSALVTAAVNWPPKRTLRRVSVVTQGRNIAAQRLYVRCGFIPCSLQLYYHKWFSPGASRVFPAGSADE